MGSPPVADAVGVIAPPRSFTAVAQLALATLALLLGGGAAAADAAVIHVAPHGDDTAAGTEAAPLRSLQRAVAVVEPGDSVLVASGTYGGFRMTASGSAAAPITISGMPGAQRPTITASGSSNSIVLLDGVHDVRLRGLEVAGNATRWGAGIRARGGSSRIELSDLDVHDNSSFGILLEDVTDTVVSSSRLYKNETGLQVSRAGAGIEIAGNDVYDNDRLIVNDDQPGNDRGANAMVFYRTRGPLTVEGNRAWGNRGTSRDWGFDGGAFEVYAASGLTIRDNVVWDNQNVMETGTDGTLPCEGNSFTGNVAYGGGGAPSMGLILRCASGMVVAGNTLDDLDRFAIDVTAAARSFGGSIEGLRVTRNITVSGADKLLSIDSALPPSVVIDDNLVFNRAGGYVGYVFGRGNTRSLSTFVAWTGQQASGVQADPLFLDPAGADYRLRAATPRATWGAGRALELARSGRACNPETPCAPPADLPAAPQQSPVPLPPPPAAPQPSAPPPPPAAGARPPHSLAPQSPPAPAPSAPAANGRSCTPARPAAKSAERGAARTRRTGTRRGASTRRGAAPRSRTRRAGTGSTTSARRSNRRPCRSRPSPRRHSGAPRCATQPSSSARTRARPQSGPARRRASRRPAARSSRRACITRPSRGGPR